ncbi:ABC-2 type transport system ATP-binding protein [Dysgonomonas sp. PH5-45]|uniref:ABC transporter ATP-binding protein n=1 Tax=unclassified Dysgonomonas TaxID=2630389 RepID=UPI0024737AB6|nr:MULTISPECIES: ABC transporter ATP-binding protein [unclassified Dysgonomonas]MDH6353824.1 ABC-2 type transport system ATP-binding protein [Dysgonomonas sp. PH5-45]MDH6386726.1 ABC-2 type transport system ATP-binding protein [Dysgonomonas sp. PH5-37]
MFYLETKDVIKQYAGHRALDGVSIQVPEGCIYGLLGPNGAGKTTLIRIINRITAPDSGQVLIKGQPFAANDVYNIGYLPEERGLYKKMKVGEQALFLAQLRGLSKAEAWKRLDYWFKKFDIVSWKDKKIEELSKGMQQKIQFITTVIHEPDLLILDEPFSGFDPVNAELLKNEILELKAKGKTIILSTHNMESVEELCDNITLINKSRAVLQGKVEDIRRQHREHQYRIKIAEEDFNLESPLFTILSNNRYENYTEVRLKNVNEVPNSEILRLVANRYEVLLFEEELPTMNDIFIKTVTNHEPKAQ